MTAHCVRQLKYRMMEGIQIDIKIKVGEPLMTHFSLGRVGENLTRRIIFDITPWIGAFGKGTAQLLAQRQGDSAPYPVAVQIEDGKVIWDVTNVDTAAGGYGNVELQYYVGRRLAKSVIYSTIVENAISPATSKPPEPQKSWVDQVLQAGVEARAAAETAQAAAEGIENMTVSAHGVTGAPTVDKTVSEGSVCLDFGIPAGGAAVGYGAGLRYDSAANMLSVDAADVVQAGNTKPVTSAAVAVEVGNIDALLQTI